MSEKWFEELKTTVNDFFNTASDSDLKNALKKAGYERYTGVNPDSLAIKKPLVFSTWHKDCVVSFHMDSMPSKAFKTTKPMAASHADSQHIEYKEAA